VWGPESGPDAGAGRRADWLRHMLALYHVALTGEAVEVVIRQYGQYFSSRAVQDDSVCRADGRDKGNLIRVNKSALLNLMGLRLAEPDRLLTTSLFTRPLPQHRCTGTCYFLKNP